MCEVEPATLDILGRAAVRPLPFYGHRVLGEEPDYAPGEAFVELVFAGQHGRASVSGHIEGAGVVFEARRKVLHATT